MDTKLHLYARNGQALSLLCENIQKMLKVCPTLL